MTKPKTKPAPRAAVIVCEEINFVWAIDDIIRFRELWADGYSLRQIGSYFRRSLPDVLVLAADQAGRMGMTKVLGEVRRASQKAKA